MIMIVMQMHSTKRQKHGSTISVSYVRQNVTPYVHALSMHVSQFIQLHGNISKFSEGLEKLNNLTRLPPQNNHRDGSPASVDSENRTDLNILSTKDKKKKNMFVKREKAHVQNVAN